MGNDAARFNICAGKTSWSKVNGSSLSESAQSPEVSFYDAMGKRDNTEEVRGIPGGSTAPIRQFVLAL